MKFRAAVRPLFALRKSLSVVFILLVSPAVLCQETMAPTGEPVADVMQRLAGDVRLLMPLMYRPENSVNSNEMKLILQTIGNMRDHLGQVETALVPRSETYQTSLQILTDQLDQAETELEGGQVEYGMSLLRSATSVCASCHVQDDRTAKWLAPSGEIMNDPFAAGEFFFMTRQYDRSYDAFVSWLGEQRSLPYDKRTLTAFQRLLITSLQIRRSPDDINRLLNSYIHREDVGYMLRTQLVAWRDGVEELQSLTDISGHPGPQALRQLAVEWLTSNEKEGLAHVYLPENSRPRIVWLRGELYRALTLENDRSMVPRWLYWLAVSDRLLEYRFFYSLADMYLRQCMLEYSNEPVARQCYREYENYIEFFYSGSGGTYIPEDVRSELKSLKSRVYKN